MSTPNPHTDIDASDALDQLVAIYPLGTELSSLLSEYGKPDRYIKGTDAERYDEYDDSGRLMYRVDEYAEWRDASRNIGIGAKASKNRIIAYIAWNLYPKGHFSQRSHKQWGILRSFCRTLNWFRRITTFSRS